MTEASVIEWNWCLHNTRVPDCGVCPMGSLSRPISQFSTSLADL